MPTGTAGPDLRLGSPLQRIAMGMVIVVLNAPVPKHPSPSWRHFDALPDPLGWALVVGGTFALVRADEAFAPGRWLAGLAGLVSIPIWWPQIHHQLDDSWQWATSLPQLAFCLWLCREIGLKGASQQPRDPRVAKWFGLLVWGFGLLVVLPVLALGGGLDRLVAPTQLLAILVDLTFVYQLFRIHRREWLGGPGPLLVPPTRR